MQGFLNANINLHSKELKMHIKLAIVGATGMVGREMLAVLKERNFPHTELQLVASERSIGKEVEFNGKTHRVMGMQESIDSKPTIALFSAGGSASLEWAPKFAKAGCVVIDNSSAWRMDPTKKLVVPEINGHAIEKEDKIIANPNCSTIQMVMVLAPLHRKYNIKRIVISTYQSVSGTGVKAVEQLNKEEQNIDCEKAYHYPIYRNAIPHCDIFLENGYTKEEMKLTKEPLKILSDESIAITATAVRIPTAGGHSEAINIEFENDFEIDEIRKILSNTSGVVLADDPGKNVYPMPIHAKGKNEVFVGRIRRDESQPKTLNLWVVADNLRKGAATNAIQIAEYLIKQNLIN